MTNKPVSPHGYSKKELIKIIEEIDSVENHLRSQTEKPQKGNMTPNAYFTSIDKKSE